MREVPVPADAHARLKKRNSLAAARKAYNVLTLVLAFLAVLSLIGLLVCVIVLEMRENDDAAVRLLYILMGAFAAGATVPAFAAFLCGKLAQEATRIETDYRERCDGEESFFVGDGTLVTFGKDGVVLHAEAGGKKPISVPYRDMTFYSVCTRRRPREKGEWSVVLAMPSKYIVKDGKGKDAPPRALIQTDAKARLYRTLEAHGIALEGEQPTQDTRGANVRFSVRAKFLLPDRTRRKKSLIAAAVASVFAVAGILVAFFWREMLTIGTIVSVFAVFFAVRSAVAFVRAKGMAAVYEEGLFWKEGGRPSDEQIFLKWDEIVRISLIEAQGKRYMKISCNYGNYHLPDVAGAYEYIGQFRPDVCEARA